MNFRHTPEEARELVAIALESGAYKQGQGCLHNSVKDTYCCLGVAIRVFMSHEENSISVIDYSFARPLEATFDGEHAVLPSQVQEWLGFQELRGRYQTGYLVDDNDRNQLSFEQIAELFRNPPEGLLI